MDPQILAILQQQQQSQGGNQPRDIPAQDGEEQNPFSNILSGFGQAGVSPQADMQGSPLAQGMMQGGEQNQQQPQIDPKTGQPIIPPDQTQEGIATGNSKFLVSAIQSLQGFIQASSDRDEIATGRSIIALLSRLIEKDQTQEAAKLPQGNAGQPQLGE